MADTTTTQQIPVLRISLPGPGESTSYQLTADTLIKFTFDLSEAEFIGNGNNLEILVEGGGKIILVDYLLFAEMDNPPVFEMMDGEMVPGGVYLFAFEGTDQATTEDIETAADAGATGSGAGAYSDDAGSLFAGLDALGGQGDAYDTHSVEAPDPIPVELLEEPTPPVAVDDVNIIIEDEWNRGEGEETENGQGPLGFVEGNLLLNDYDADNIDYPETGGALTELSVNAIDFVGEDFTGNNPDAIAVTDAGVQVNGLYGILTVYADGSYHYELDQNLADPLREGQEVEEVFNYTAIDPDGNSSNVASLTITVVGRNDAPDAFNDTPVDDIIEQGSIVAGVAITTGNVLHNDSDVDNIGYEDLDPAYADLIPTDPNGVIELGVTSIYSYDTYQYDDTPENGVLTVEGQYGTLTINTNGSYEYVLDQEKADPLNTEDDLIETFSYSMWDGDKFDYALLTIPIHGSNDAPVAAVDTGAFTEAIDEATAAIVAGNVLANDTDIDNVDLGEVGTPELTVSDIDYTGGGTPPARTSTAYVADHIVEGEFGTLYLNNDGSYHYVEDKNATDPLNTDDAPVTDVFTYEVSDNQSGGALTDTATLTITISGANDSPVATLDTNAFTEAVDAAAAADVFGNVLANDTDIDNVDLGEVGTPELTVSDIDYTGGGTPPARTSTAYVADHIVEGEFGTLYLNNDGSYHYVEDKNATDPLNTDDAPVTDVFTYEVSDNQSGGALTDTATLTITISGANDSPVATLDTNAFTEAVDTAAAADVFGNVLANDTDIDNVDLGEVGTPELTVSDIDYTGGGTPPARTSTAYVADHIVEGEFGTLYLNNDGSYHYVEDKNATDPLNTDDAPVTDVFTYEVSDNQSGGALTDTATLTITISGANDSPVATLDTNAFTEAVDTAAAADVFGNVLANDTDIDNVDLGEVGTPELTVSDIDYTGGGTPPARTSTAYVADHIVEGEFGTLYLNNDGSYHYVEDKNATDPLNTDDAPVTDVFTYEVSDNQSGGALTDTATLTITISGANDSPVATLDTNAFTEAVDTAAAADVFGNVLANDTDIDNVDLGEVGTPELTVSDIDYTGGGTPPARTSTAYVADHIVEGEFGTLYLNNDGSYHYVEDKNATDPLNTDDAPVTDVFTYEVSDNQSGGALTDTATLTITISGANDSPVATLDTNAFTEAVDTAAAADVFGNVLANDTDIDNVDLGEVGTPELTVSDIDYTGGGTPPARTSTAYVADHIVEGEFGTLYLNNDGSYHYVEDKNATDPLNTDDAPVTDVFTYEVSDNQSGGALTDTATLTITISGANDSPVATLDTNAFTEAVDAAAAGDVFGNVLANDTDIDNVDLGEVGTPELTVSDIDYTGGGTPPARTSTAYVADHIVEGEFGTLYLNNDGSYHYVEDKNATDPLNTDDAPVTDVFTYEVSDNQSGGALTDTATLTITISGANDSPVATLDTNAFTEAVDAAAAGDVFGNVLANDTDIDNVDLGDIGTPELTVSGIDYTGGGTPPARTSTEYVADHVIEGVWGTLYINEDGSYHYVEDKDATDPLNIDDAAVTDVFTYEVSDNQSGGALTDTATLTITIDPANDTPIAVHDGSHDIFIETSVVTVIDDWSNISGSVYNGPGYSLTAQAFDSFGDPVSDVAFTTWGNDQHLGIYTGGPSDDQKVDDTGATEQITFEFDDPQTSFSIEFIAQGSNHVNAYVYPVGGGTPTLFTNVGNAVYITPGFEFDTIVFIPDGSFGMESLTTVTGGESSISGVADGNVLANDYDVDNVDFDSAVAAGNMSLLELSVTDVDSTNAPGNTPTTGSDIDGDYFSINGEFGSLKVYDTGEWAYTPFEEVNGEGGWQNLDSSSTDVFEYTVSDGSGGTDTAFIEVSLNVNTGNVLGGSGTVLGSASDDVIFPVDGDDVYSGAGSDMIVIDPENLGSDATSIDIFDFSDVDSLALGNLEGATVEITSNTNDVNLVFTDIDGSDDIVVNLLGVTPVNDAVNQVVEITTSDDLNALIQSIIDSGNDAII
nr:VCBS domain-containing protein [uncultured Pseudodesulfovibrio sp.]